MSIYSYKNSRVIDEVTFRKSEGGHLRAYLRAAPSADPAALQGIIHALGEQGLQCAPFNLGGKPTLEVQGVRKEKNLLQFLTEKQWLQGMADHMQLPEDKRSLGETIRKRSLAASGAFYLIGDVSFSTYGYKGNNPLNLAAGGFYGAGTLSMLGFGRKDPSDLQVRDIAKKLADYMDMHGSKLPECCSLDSIVRDHHRGLLKKADDLFRRYPSELMNLFFAAAGVCIATAAYKSHANGGVTAAEVEEVFTRRLSKFQKSFPHTPLSSADQQAMRAELQHKMHVNHYRENKLDMGLGIMTSLSGLLAVLVKEKGRDPDAPEKHGWEKVWQAIQEKPLAIAGVGYMVSTLCHAVSTTLAWNYASNDRRKSVPFRAAFVASNIIAEILLAISSKGHGEGVISDKSVDNTVMALAADLIVSQPAQMQEGLIDHVARFLGRPDVLALKNEEVTRLLHEQVEAMRNNPWSASQQKGKMTAPVQSSASNWQTRTMDSSAVPTTPSLQ